MTRFDRRQNSGNFLAFIAAGAFFAAPGYSQTSICPVSVSQGSVTNNTLPIHITARDGNRVARAGAAVVCQLMIDGRRSGNVQQHTTDPNGSAICNAGAAITARRAHMRWTVIASHGCENRHDSFVIR